MLNVAIGDWVVATTSDDEMVHGYVESVAGQLGIAFVKVIASDQDEIIGHHMEVKLATIKKLPVRGWDTDESIRSVIDVALSLKDEKWFMELTETLHAIQAKTSSVQPTQVAQGFFKNRLGVDQL
ncbi:hypothetical protein [Paenibacillus roseipurpureus]|uniref:IDEAL domain-containing protein n=1 Tax=Paenibacillus roseopurpureus TaxID=2918901 RepID=A0AA96RKE0_9BACL|nr:hypothetical protein [Paenibacillus sp. MBLB1832]WNR46248.1 hypothetical protein MJB10_09185 [Paenibacillus sp. MBLB1832]